MSAVSEVAEALLAAVAAVDGVRAYRDPAATISPPGVVLGPPALVWSSYCAGPTTATFVVYVVEKVGKRSLEDMWDLVPLVAAAVDTVPDAVVTRADPGVFNAGGTELPAYELTVECGLR